MWIMLYIATIVVANWAITTFGMVPVGFGLLAPAGVYMAGLAFTIRDKVHDRYGVTWTLVAIGGGTIVSALLSPQLALASGVAFGISELADLAVYAPLRRRSWVGAVLLSNTVGLVIDSMLFLWLAFGSLDYLAGQVVGKGWMTLAVVGLVWLWENDGKKAV